MRERCSEERNAGAEGGREAFCFVFCCVSFFLFFKECIYNVVYCILLLLTHVLL